MPGKLFPAKSIMRREHAGEFKSDDGRRYELSRAFGTPLVRSCKTGKWWVIDWTDLVGLAVAAGIDEPGEIPAVVKGGA